MSQPNLSEKIADYIQARAVTKFEGLEKKAKKERQRLADDVLALKQYEAEWQKQWQAVQDKFYPANWLSDAAKRASQISFVTHAIKFTHADAKGTSIYAEKSLSSDSQEQCYLSTASLKKPTLDVVGNAAALNVAGLLRLESNGEMLIDQLASGNVSALEPFAENAEQLSQWLSGFQSVLSDREPATHTYAKQVYFPVSDDEYHLLGPLFATSLTQAVHERIIHHRSSETAKAAHKARREERYTSDLVVNFPNTAVQAFGGTKPQNVSQLNTSRHGQMFLLSCQPPTWRQQLKLPVNSETAFWDQYDRRANKQVKALREYLLAVADRKRNDKIRAGRAGRVDELINLLLVCADEIQRMKTYAGWSVNSKLPIAEQIWLDPSRNDPAFQAIKDQGEWKQRICQSFASWLNRRLTHKKLTFGDVEYLEWASLLKEKLALYK